MSTPHIRANTGEIAKTVIMPGDPLRAKFIAENYLKDYKIINDIRNMLGYTGLYKGVEITVLGSGMGVGSMGIYSYELFNFYNVENIIRAGSSGSISKKLPLNKILLAMGASTNSGYAKQYKLPGDYSAICDFSILYSAYNTAKELNLDVLVGNILTSDTFYTDDKENDLVWNKMDVLAVEMEAAALYMNAARAGKKALCMTTVSDNILTGEGLSAQDRQTGFKNMISLALETGIKL
ncbi:MAG: purine-nucleoside phosphorylase [Ruminococcaceae bacterium]|nr:purine-nucleoside phosphorylase [Oscillospiraceae bacterium]